MPLDDTNWTAPEGRSSGGAAPLTETEADEATAFLIRARDYLERGWCRGRIAVDVEGRLVSAISQDAVAWCAEGALVAAGVPHHTGLFGEHLAYRHLEEALGDDFGFLGGFNDRQESVEPILAAFDRAIAAAGREG